MILQVGGSGIPGPFFGRSGKDFQDFTLGQAAVDLKAHFFVQPEGGLPVAVNAGYDPAAALVAQVLH